MQQPKIEVRVRDETRKDEACAKWSTVREREYEVLWGKKPDGKQNKGENTRKGGKEGDERRRTQQLRGYICNKNLSEREDQQCGEESALSQSQIRQMDANTGGKVKRKFLMARGTDVLLVLTICPCIKSSMTARSDGLARVRSKSNGND